MNLFINLFEHENKKRKEEIDLCFERNKSNKHFNKIIVVNRGDRATYGDFFRAMQSYPRDVNIIANLDIYFDDSIRLAENIKERQCYALTRWEDYNGSILTFKQRHGRNIPSQWSQDAWIMRGSVFNPKKYDAVIAVNLNTRISEQIPFSLGIPGCDNKIAAMLKGYGYDVSNPSQSIKAIHLHREESRNYPKYQILRGIKPHGLVYASRL